ncbi:MAG TPA: FtsX-like permease family protein [Cyclobacteriaceae bacterium]|nr:FtsX-like permease family protein [Cyclobacteriaceae bacterium]
MNLSYFISKRISREETGTFSATIHKVAIITITVGLGAAIVSFLIMSGFQSTVKNKIYSFSSHMLIRNIASEGMLEERPFYFNTIDLIQHPENYPMVSHVQEYAHKPGIIKTDDELMGIAFKGITKSFDTKAFNENMVEGEFIHLSDTATSLDVVLSRTIADKVNAKVGDDVIVHFFQNPPRFRRLKVTGIYETNLSEYFDSKVIIGDMRLVQQLNDWADGVAGGVEVFIDFKKFDRSELFSLYMSDAMDYIWDSDWTWFEKVTETYNAWSSYNFEEMALEETRRAIGEGMDFDHKIDQANHTYQVVFEWLGLIQRQVLILLAIILVVVCVNMISVVLILVMERTPMIGMLKALGAKNRQVRSIFIFNGVNLIFRGLVLGNVLGLGLCFLQDKFRIMKLNPHDYYMAFVPIGWSLETVLLLNLLVLGVVTVVLLIPTAITARISPIKAIRFD